VDFQYSPEAVTIIVTFTEDYSQPISARKRQGSCFSLSQSIAPQNINTWKLSYIPSISWLLQNRHNSKNKEEKGNSSFYNADQISVFWAPNGFGNQTL